MTADKPLLKTLITGSHNIKGNMKFNQQTKILFLLCTAFPITHQTGLSQLTNLEYYTRFGIELDDTFKDFKKQKMDFVGKDSFDGVSNENALGQRRPIVSKYPVFASRILLNGKRSALAC